MSKQSINVGTSPNDKSGDKLRDAMIKINSNFDELYSGLTGTTTVYVASSLSGLTTTQLVFINGLLVSRINP